ncbi:unnamed protein product [Colletotrichum noveboracense]|uniref:Uncharacterized protein n=1 Tax=Colletotrichum noveboracense TaxID=2664923 RepID=A0A9W4RLD5_9PEZI|nr:unnamed protein product [Colletotrichum noveboracense]
MASKKYCLGFLTILETDEPALVSIEGHQTSGGQVAVWPESKGLPIITTGEKIDTTLILQQKHVTLHIRSPTTYG